MLVAARLCPSIVAQIGEPAVHLSWKRSLDVLCGYHHFSKASQRCIAALKILDEEIKSEKQGSNSSPMAEGHQCTGLTTVIASYPEGENFGFSTDFGALPSIMDLQDLTWLDIVPEQLNFNPSIF